jgi:hypothetical protein
MPEDRHEPAEKGPPVEDEASMSELQSASAKLKAKIAAAKARSDMPLDSTLGDPNWDRAAADGHLDLPDDDDGWPRPPAKPDKIPPP